MVHTPLVVSLPIADRRASLQFYGDGLGIDAIGEPAEDGAPSLLRFALNDGVRIMLVPTGGFGWIIGDHEVAPPGRSECVLNLVAGTEDGRHVDDDDAAGGRGRPRPARELIARVSRTWGTDHLGSRRHGRDRPTAPGRAPQKRG